MQFHTRLREAMTGQGVSARELGRRISPAQPESGRRMVQDYLAGRTVPRRKRRRELAVALGLPDDHLDEVEGGTVGDQQVLARLDTIQRDLEQLNRDLHQRISGRSRRLTDDERDMERIVA